MDDQNVSNEYERSTVTDLKRTFVTLPPFSSIRANAIENVRNEYRPIAYEEFLNYIPQNPAINCSLSIEDFWRESQEANANGLVSCLQGQNNFQEAQPNAISECIEFIGHNELYSENFVSQSEGSIRSEIPLDDSSVNVSVIQSERLDANLGRNSSEIKSESIELRKVDFKLDTGLDFYESSINSDH
ncbi:zinc finger protein 16 [Trichonephila clavipes]|nr:zinc finger protein 16 [Trichonephila clavipes]